MSDGAKALQGPLSVAAVLLAALAVLWALIAQEVTRYIVPPPEQAAEQFLKSLKAHNFTTAPDHLTEELRRTVTPEQLGDLTRQIESSAAQGIEEVQGESAQEQGDTAQAAVKVKLKDNSEQTLTLLMQKENGRWLVASLDPVLALAGQ